MSEKSLSWLLVYVIQVNGKKVNPLNKIFVHYADMGNVGHTALKDDINWFKKPRFGHNQSIMRKKAMSLNEVKDSIASLKGKMLDIRINKGRKKIVKCVGEVVDIYPSVFTMRLSGGENGLMSCSYSDVICGMVTLKNQNV